MTPKTNFLSTPAVLFCLLLMSCSGCVQEPQQAVDGWSFSDAGEPGGIGPLIFDQNDITLKGMLKSNFAKGELLLVMNIENRREDDIRIHLSNCYLSLDDGREAIPDLQEQAGVHVIKPGANGEYQLRYYPVNTVSFYDRTDYRGDMKKKYDLRIDFVKAEDGTLLMDDLAQFEFSNSAYSAYLDSAREKNMHIFDFGFDPDDFVDAQEKYLSQIFVDGDSTHEIFAITPAIAVDRTVINFRTFSEGDTLTIDMRMLNQSAHTFDVIADRCLVISGGKKFKPCKSYSDSFPGNRIDSIYAFRPGTRLHLRHKYLISQQAEQWKLSADWMLIHRSKQVKKSSTEVPFFYSSLLFRESSITRKE